MTIPELYLNTSGCQSKFHCFDYHGHKELGSDEKETVNIVEILAAVEHIIENHLTLDTYTE